MRSVCLKGGSDNTRPGHIVRSVDASFFQVQFLTIFMRLVLAFGARGLENFAGILTWSLLRPIVFAR